MKRIPGFLVLLAAAWSVMAVTHELGHVIAGWLGGGTLQSVDLCPWHLPYSLFDPDPHPLMTLWSGPLFGVFLPLAIAGLIRHRWTWLIAHFCMLANGLYLGVALFEPYPFLDTTKLLEHGASPASVALFGLMTTGYGYIGFRRSCIDWFLKGNSPVNVLTSEETVACQSPQQ